MNKIKAQIKPFAIIFCLAFLLRLAFDLILRRYYFFYDYPSSDVEYYFTWAKEIATFNWIGTKTFFGLPLYPYYLATLYKLFFGNIVLIRIFNLILGSINCLLIYIISEKVFSKRIALLSSVLMATNFELIYYDWLLMPVTLIIFLNSIIIISFLYREQIKTKREWFFLGLISGLAMLGDGKFFILIACLMLYLLYESRKSLLNGLSKTIIPIILGIILIVFSCGVRNRIVGGSWVWVTAQSGLSFYVGNNESANGIYSNPEFIRPTHQAQDEDQIIVAEAMSHKKLNAIQVSKFWQDKALMFISQKPLNYLKLLFKKFCFFFTQAEKAYDLDLILLKKWKNLFDYNPFFIICPLFILGMFLARHGYKGTPLLNFAIAAQLIFTLIFFLNNRHRTSVLPYIIIYESFAILWLIDNFRSFNLKKIMPALIFLTVFMVLFKPIKIESSVVDFLKYSKSGAIYEEQKRYVKARGQYFKALSLQPKDTNTLTNLGNSYANQSLYIQAQACYLKAIKLNPYEIDARYNLAFTYEKQNRLDEAMAAYNNVLSLNDQSIDAHFRLAEIYQTQNKCALVKKHYAAIIKIDPSLTNLMNTTINKCN